MTVEIDGIVAYATTTGVPMRVTSTLRPGATTTSGHVSAHAAGLAVDWAGPTPGRDTEALADIFHAFLPVERHLTELIYAGPQAAFNIKNGRRVGRYATAAHHDHVHVAVNRGVLLDRATPFRPDTIIAPAPDDTDGREPMADPTSALCAPGGGVWVVTRDGGVRAYRNAPFYGSYPGLPAQHRQGVRTFVDISERDDGLPGYMLHASDGALYRFP